MYYIIILLCSVNNNKDGFYIFKLKNPFQLVMDLSKKTAGQSHESARS